MTRIPLQNIKQMTHKSLFDKISSAGWTVVNRFLTWSELFKRFQIVFLLLLFLILFGNHDTSAQNSVTVTSTDGYSVTIELNPSMVNVTSSYCPSGYNYNVSIPYKVTFSGANIPAGGLYTLLGSYLRCSGTDTGFPILYAGGHVNNGTNQMGTQTTYTGSKGNCTNYPAPGVTPENLGCNVARIQIAGPGISDQIRDITISYNTCPSPPSATISYAGSPFCPNSPDVTVSLTGTTGGTFTATPLGLSIDAMSGTIKPSISTPGDYTVSYDIAAAGGCPAAKSTTAVSVRDNTAPTAKCQDITVQIPMAGDITINAAIDINNGSTDNCGIASYSLSKSVFTCSNLGPNSVTLTVTDGSSNSSTCSATVTVQDNNIPPIISYAGSPVCKSNPDVTVSLTGIAGGTFTAAPMGLSIDAMSGTIKPSISTPGDYTVSYDIAALNGCSSGKATAKITIYNCGITNDPSISTHVPVKIMRQHCRLTGSLQKT
ncbi:MAG: hypothetical protein IPO98_08665 [Saprospiraceae bacterium]|nr:hypothetical protein [Saprospiraceae bacterium]